MHKGVNSRPTYTFPTIGKACIGDVIPYKRSACMRQLPTLFFTVDQVCKFSLNPTGAGLVVCASLRRSVKANAQAKRGELYIPRLDSCAT